MKKAHPIFALPNTEKERLGLIFGSIAQLV